MIYLIAFLAAGVALLRWTYVTNRNAHAWSEAMTVSPGWNVGWFFIPRHLSHAKARRTAA